MCANTLATPAVRPHRLRLPPAAGRGPMRRWSRQVILFLDRSRRNKVAHLNSKMQQAQILHREGRLDDARTLCEELLRGPPGGFEALSLLALIAAQQGDFERAIACYDRVIANRPGFADGYSNRGASFAALNQ